MIKHSLIRTYGTLLGCAPILAAATASLAAQTPPAGIVEDRERAIDQFVAQFVDLGMFDGTVLVDIGGEIVYEKSFGYAHYELDVPHDGHTRFRIASVSKALTDAAFAVMIQQGVFTLDTPISRYLPDFPSANTITVGHLLNHTSGIPHTNDQPWGNGKVSFTIEEIVERLAELPFDFEPGTDSKYSNGGYAVAARVLEIAGGGTFAQVMRANVFEPLGMRDTDHIADARAPISRIATGYERDVLGAEDGGFQSQGRSPGFVAKLYYNPESDIIVVSLANNYAVPADWALAIADLAMDATDREPWPALQRAPATISPDDRRLGRYINSFGGRELTIERSKRGAMVINDPISESITALVPLEDGSFLQPLYFQRCEQARETRVITCRMLSGNERYTSTLSPITE
ncbi:MAG: serine hydrolase [Gemmatimonadota bacterium]